MVDSSSVNVMECSKEQRQLQVLNQRLASVAIKSVSRSAWRNTNAPIASSRTDDIWFADPEVGWLVNSSGFVCKTTDGGKSWTPQLFLSGSSTGNPYLRTIQFANYDIGWFGALAAGEGYPQVLLHHTQDGGTTWTPVTNLPSDVPPGICGLSVVSEKVVYAAGTNNPNVNAIGPLKAPAVLKTVDGGASWQLISGETLGSPDNLIDVHFFDENYGFVVGGKNQDDCPRCTPACCKPGYVKHPQYAALKPVVLRTKDGGKTWTNVVESLTEQLECGGWGWKIDYLDRQRIFVSIENLTAGFILKTLDGGDSWQVFSINDRRLHEGSEVSNANLEGIGFIDENTGWVGGWGNVDFYGRFNSFTQDGGQNWEAQDNIPNDSDSDVRVNVNRYRFFHLSDKLIGYCSGESVYKLVHHWKKDCLTEPTQAASQTSGQMSSGQTQGSAQTHNAIAMEAAPAQTSLEFACAAGKEEGTVKITYRVPANAQKIFVGIWSHFGWHVRTLIDEHNPLPGLRTLIWDGKDGDGKSLGGTHIFRIACDGFGESQNCHLPQMA